ncbi:patatin-like phospholipase family protein [Parvularcula lutaonensis]|uniref:Patatin-like phospholipase family protein n=1 Tax=Parvularcula lutaonensis TaxID=491923 RepID=A0ABV7MC93_9PROT|nr:patatin-like phospholipase family protein [Parvularcula lutaonensis]GGY50012.1 hypothetical protein GCM10007148_18450 [Parvularcula lutaonensis]
MDHQQPLNPRRLLRRAVSAFDGRTRGRVLALQGGGALGAFTYGALDKLLEAEDRPLTALSGASAGAMNAAILATGLVRGGRQGARDALAAFWDDVARGGAFAKAMLLPRKIFGFRTGREARGAASRRVKEIALEHALPGQAIEDLPTPGLVRERAEAGRDALSLYRRSEGRAHRKDSQGFRLAAMSADRSPQRPPNLTSSRSGETLSR